MVFGVAGNHDGTQMWCSKSKVVFGTVKRRGQGRVSSAVIVCFVIAFAQATSPSRPRRHVAISLFKAGHAPRRGLNVPSAGLDAGCPRPASFVQLHGLPAFRP